MAHDGRITPQPTMREPAPTSAGPLDMAMDAERHDLASDSPAREVLRKHARLLDEQIALACNERFRNRIKAARDLSLASGVALLIFGALWLVWDASRARGVVVEPFSVPRELAAQGLTGEVAAARVLDHVVEMEPSAEELALAGAGVRGSGSGGVRIEIPQAGVSLDEASRWLRRTLGHEATVTGDIRRHGDRLSIAGQPADVVTGPPADLDRALELAAEQLYVRIEPLRYSRHLVGRADDAWFETRRRWASAEAPPSPDAVKGAQRARWGTYARAIEISRGVALDGGPDQAWGYAFWGVQLWARGNERTESVRLLELARRLDPTLAYAPATLTSIHNVVGEPHLEREAARNAYELFGRRRADVDPRHMESARLQMAGSVSRTEGAFGEGARRYCETADRGLYVTAFRRGCAVFLARNHDPRRAEAEWTPVDERSRGFVNSIIFEVWLAQTRGDSEAELNGYRRWLEASVVEDREERAPFAVWPGMAVALAQAGRQAEAEALSVRLPECYECFRARGRVAALGRDWAQAERWLGAAARRGPEIPFAYYDLAQARFARGELDGALAALRDAREHGPRWSDPLKLEGDVLARQGKHAAATRRYREAAERAPRWGALHLAWGRSLQALGREERAYAKYAQAARLDLSAADRTAVRRLLGRPVS